jgi:hypothetical protein
MWGPGLEEGTMRVHRAVPCALALLLALQACRPSGGGGPTPLPIAPPPTFVLAWNGPAGAITTAESSDGVVWTWKTVHARAAEALPAFRQAPPTTCSTASACPTPCG